MVQSEINGSQLKHETASQVRKRLKKLKKVEPTYLRWIIADNRTRFGCNEEFESEERDLEIITAWKDKVGLNRIKY